jgi:hypothetical protein
MKEKRWYNACITCKREVKPQSGPFSYCLHCHKPSKHFTRFLFDIELSDSTGSLSASLSSDILEGFISMSA